MNKLLAAFTFSIIFSVTAGAEDAKVPCLYKDGTLGLNTLDSFDCKLASRISSDVKIKDEYKDFVDKKLAVSLTQKSSDLVEDLALLDSYFDQNGIDLGTNERVRNSCQLEKIGTPVCGKNVKREFIEKKMGFILASDKFLPRDEAGNNSLYKRLLSKANQVRSGSKLKDVNKCPVEGNPGNFILSSQFTSSDARTLIGYIKKGDLQNGALIGMYNNYPQLKMLVNGKDESLKIKFEEAMKNFSNPGGEKQFIDDFFREKSNQESMADSVASKCDELKNSIQKFVCKDDYPHLGMKEEDRDYFFENSNDDKIFKEVSRGLSCEMEEKAGNVAKDPFIAKDTIHDKMELYQRNLREPEGPNVINEKLGPFCDLYLCKSELVKEDMLSCKKGGPITAADLLQICIGKIFKNELMSNDPQEILKNCDPKVQKYYSYLSLLERDAINSGVGIGSVASNNINSSSPDGSQKPRGFSSFYQNFLGVEGTIAAEGKKVTPITIAEKKAEFAEKKMDTVPTSLVSLNQSKDREIQRMDNRQDSISPNLESSSGDDTPVVAIREPDQYRRSFHSQQLAKPNYDITKDANGKSKKIKFTDTESSTLDEMKKLRAELADTLGKVKGTEEEQLAAVAANNAVAISPKGSKKDPVKNLNTGEKERLDAYRESLNNWEGRLRTWQGNLSDRDVRINSGGGSSISESKTEAPVANNDHNNVNNNGVGAKLSKTAAAGTQIGAKNEAGAERAPGSEKVEGETGVVNSENMATLGKESLKKLGIVLADSFIIKVRHKEKVYSVPVKTFNHDGKSMYVPLLNDKDRELSKIVYESPLFKDYRDYQVKRQYQLDQTNRGL